MIQPISNNHNENDRKEFTVKNFREISALTEKKVKNAETIVVNTVENKRHMINEQVGMILIGIKKITFEKPAKDLIVANFYNQFRVFGDALPTIPGNNKIIFEFGPAWNNLAIFNGKLKNIIGFVSVSCGVNVIWPDYPQSTFFLPELMSKTLTIVF